MSRQSKAAREEATEAEGLRLGEEARDFLVSIGVSCRSCRKPIPHSNSAEVDDTFGAAAMCGCTNEESP